MQPPQLQQRFWFEVPLPRALRGLLAYQERLPSPLWVFIMAQCCKITGFPQCFLLFARLCHGNLERIHVGDSGLSCKAPHSGIHDVSASCAKAFLRLLSDSSTQEFIVGMKKLLYNAVAQWEKSEVWLDDTHEVQCLLHYVMIPQICIFTQIEHDVLNMEYKECHCSH